MSLYKGNSGGFGGSVYAKPIMPIMSGQGTRSAGAASSSSSSNDVEDIEGLKGQTEAYMQNQMLLEGYKSKAFNRAYKILEDGGSIEDLNNDEELRRISNMKNMIEYQSIIDRNHLKNIKKDYDEKESQIRTYEAHNQHFFHKGRRMWVNPITKEIVSQDEIDNARSKMSSNDFEVNILSQYRPMKVSDYDMLQYLPNSVKDENTGMNILTGPMSPDVYDEKSGIDPFTKGLRDLLSKASGQVDEQGSKGYDMGKNGLAMLMQTGLLWGSESNIASNEKAVYSTINNYMNQMSAGEKQAMVDQYYRQGYDERAVDLKALTGAKNMKELKQSGLYKAYSDLIDENGFLRYDENDNLQDIKRKRQVKQQMFVIEKGRAHAGTYTSTQSSSSNFNKSIGGFGPSGESYEGADANVYSMVNAETIRKINSGETIPNTLYYKMGTNKKDPFKPVETMRSETWSPALATEMNKMLNVQLGESGEEIQTDHIVIGSTVYGKKEAIGIFKNARVTGYQGRFVRQNKPIVSPDGQVKGLHRGEDGAAGTQLYAYANLIVDAHDIKDNALYSYPDSDTKEGEGVESSTNVRKTWIFNRFPSEEMAGEQGWTKIDEDVYVNGKKMRSPIQVKALVPIDDANFEASPTLTPNEHNATMIREKFNRINPSETFDNANEVLMNLNSEDGEQ